MPRNKYGAIKTKVEGITFDSKGEANRWLDLRLKEKLGLICQLRRQIKYELVVKGKKVCTYIADFVYIRDGETVVEDFKGVVTSTFRIKWKLLGILYPELTLEIYPAKKPRKPTSSFLQRL